MGIHDVDATRLIYGVAEELKKLPEVKPAEWAPFVKTGISRERAPVQVDWWHIRAAAVLRKIFVLGPIGTSKLKTKFGGRKNRGVKPERFFPGAGNNIRKILQQLEKAGLAKQVERGNHKGRVVTAKGQGLLESVANSLMKSEGIVLPKKAVKSEALKVEKTEVSSETESAEKPKKPRAPRKPRVKKAEEAPAAE